MKNSQLEVKVVDGKLVIEIGTSLLCHAVTMSDYFNQFEDLFTITNEEEFVEGILGALLLEEEDGSTLVHKMFDKAAEFAIEDGCEGIEFEEDEE